jgi:outer membrane protein assembly factor BamE (lipoprotein component of BamABCDE complex)
MRHSYLSGLPLRYLRPTFLAFAAAAVLIAACAPVENQRGYVPDMAAIQSIQVGTDTKDTVSKKLGDPSTSATFGNDVWYYYSAHVEQNAFFAPMATDRNILAVEFTRDGHVSDVHHYTLSDGHVIDPVDRETPTRGRDLTLLQQIFNSVPGKIGQPGSANQPGGGQGPGPGPQ